MKHYLNSFDYADHVNGTTRLKLTQGSMNSIPVPLPPLAEQKRIVAKMEELLASVNAARDHLARVPAILKRFRQAVLEAAFSGLLTSRWRDATMAGGRDDAEPEIAAGNGALTDLPGSWALISLGDAIADGPQNGLYKPRSAYGSGTPIIRINDYQDGTLRPRDQLLRLHLDDAERRLYELREGDVLVNRVNSPSHLGKTLVVPSSVCPAVFESNMMRFRVSPAMNPRFLELYLNSQMGRKRLTQDAKWAVNQASINQNDVASTQIPLPPAIEQGEVVRQVLALFAITDMIQRSVAEAFARSERLTQAILARAFRGELAGTEPT